MGIKVGILGYGNLGRFLAREVLSDNDFELSFVWNRTRSSIGEEIDDHLILEDIEEVTEKEVDLVVEVAHPSITRKYGSMIVKHSHYMIGSPSVLTDEEVQHKLTSTSCNHGVFIPVGAFWGGEDIRKMADAGTLERLEVTMIKHPRSLKLLGDLKLKNSEVFQEPVVLYEGPVRNLCSMAPQNTNLMAVAAVAAHNLGFDGVKGRLVSDPRLNDYHIVEIEARGLPLPDGSFFSCHTVRKNPATTGHVTGTATYQAFFQSLKSPTLRQKIKGASENFSAFQLC